MHEGGDYSHGDMKPVENPREHNPEEEETCCCQGDAEWLTSGYMVISPVGREKDVGDSQRDSFYLSIPY